MTEKYQRLQKIAMRFNPDYYPSSGHCAFVGVPNRNGEPIKMATIAMESGGPKYLANGWVLQTYFAEHIQRNNLVLMVLNTEHLPVAFVGDFRDFIREENIPFDLSELDK